MGRWEDDVLSGGCPSVHGCCPSDWAGDDAEDDSDWWDYHEDEYMERYYQER